MAGSKHYTYRGPRTLEHLVEFALENKYEEAEEVEEIPARLEGFDKFKKESKDFLS
jgi:hypothetical protein